MTKNPKSNEPVTHFQRTQLIAVHRLIYYLYCLEQNDAEGDSLDRVFEQYPFLSDAFNALRPVLPEEISWEDSFGHLEKTLSKWESGTSSFLPMRALQEHARLDLLTLQTLMLIGLIEDSHYFGDLYRKLQKPLESCRPTVQLITDILETGDEQKGMSLQPSIRAMLSSGLVEIVNPTAPRADWQLRIPPAIWDLLKGESSPQIPDYFAWHPAESFPHVKELLLLADEKERLVKIPALLKSGQVSAFVLRGIQGSERMQIVGSVARAMGANLVSAEGSFSTQDDRWHLLGPIAALTQSLPVFCLKLSPGETFELPRLISYNGPVIIVMEEAGGVKGSYIEKAISFTLSFPAPNQRYAHWQQAFQGNDSADISLITERFLLPGNTIKKAARLAINQAHLEGSEHVELNHVRQASDILNRQRLETLAQRLCTNVRWMHLVVNRRTETTLEQLIRRCRFREKLQHKLGIAFDGNLNRGVRALFNGPSGTGKSLAARIAATELGLDIYKVDLSAVVNKYIGETEKNLHQIFSRAEEMDVVLLLDEGDSLLSSRTQVRSANDRYANLETNYLLQRLENYNGILFITTNLGENVDRAFQRRIDVHIEFNLPEAEERYRIWEIHLPDVHEISGEYLRTIAVRCALSGGQIRNAALFAACAALENKEQHISEHHLELAIENEYRKAGSVSPLKPNGTISDNGQERLESMISAME